MSKAQSGDRFDRGGPLEASGSSKSSGCLAPYAPKGLSVTTLQAGLHELITGLRLEEVNLESSRHAPPVGGKDFRLQPDSDSFLTFII